MGPLSPCCTLNITTACAAKDAEIAELKQRLGEEPEDVQVAKAERDRALDLLADLLADRKGNEFEWMPRQATWRAVKSLIAGRKR